MKISTKYSEQQLFSMRNVLILLVLFCNSFASAQELSKSEIKRLERLDIVDAYNSAMESNLPITDFREIVKIDKGIGTREISGSIIRTIGTLSLVLGTTFVIASSNQEGSALGQAIGAMTMGVGVVTYGVSIPLKIGAKNKRMQRDVLVINTRNKINNQ